MLGRGKAATRLNSWSRCLDREDGIPSPASLSSLTAVACTKSWSQMAARWKSIRRRTGETTVRIFIATRLVNRNWVRNPVSASPPSDVTCALHSYSTDFDVWDIMCSDAKQLISMERNCSLFITKSKQWFLKAGGVSRSGEKGYVARNLGKEDNAFPVSPFLPPTTLVLPDVFPVSSVLLWRPLGASYHSNAVRLNMSRI